METPNPSMATSGADSDGGCMVIKMPNLLMATVTDDVLYIKYEGGGKRL